MPEQMWCRSESGAVEHFADVELGIFANSSTVPSSLITRVGNKVTYWNGIVRYQCCNEATSWSRSSATKSLCCSFFTNDIGIRPVGSSSGEAQANLKPSVAAADAKILEIEGCAFR
ncbi:hypothetical protein Tco_0004265 [Tanacetum coccineum]